VTLRDDERNTIINYRLNQAVQALEDADFLLNHKKLSLAANRIYYSLFYALTAIALKDGFSTSKHKQLIGWFNKKYIKTSLVDIKYSKLIYSAYENREKGDYDFLFTLTYDEIANSRVHTEEFVNKIIPNLLTQ